MSYDYKVTVSAEEFRKMVSPITFHGRLIIKAGKNSREYKLLVPRYVFQFHSTISASFLFLPFQVIDKLMDLFFLIKDKPDINAEYRENHVKNCFT